MSQRKHFGLKIIESCGGEVTREADPEDRWDGEDSAHWHTVHGIEPCDENPDLAVPFEPVPGTVVFLLTCVWSTGDSFHSESGCHTHVAAFLDRSLAERAGALIEAHHFLSKTDHSCSSLSIVSQDGFPELVSPSWNGYFEGLESVNIESFAISTPAASSRRARRP